MSKIRIAVLSDIHAYSKGALDAGQQRPSFVEVGAPSDSPGTNPFTALKELVQNEGLEADLLVCAGDLADRAHPASTVYSWARVRELKEQLSAKALLATAGNHDLDSRFIHNDHDARSVLQGLIDFPFSDPALNNEYWARNLVVQVRDELRYVVLNSAAHHGYQDEYAHGRISSRTLDYLKAQLAATQSKDVNLLVVHHHLSKVTGVDRDDASEMTHGAALLDTLDSGDYGRWLVIHGHRHFPYISYGPGTAESSVIFSAGSFSAVLYDEIQGKARNQFYIIEIEPSTTGRVRGTFRAWDWISDEGFVPAQAMSGLPHRGGFGSPHGATALAQEIATALGDDALLVWATLEERLPELRFTAPRDLKACKGVLQKAHGISLIYSDEGVPIQVGRS